MTRAELERYIWENYPSKRICPWAKYPNFATFRHRSNDKCFAIVMDIPKTSLGLKDSGIISVVNLKCDPIMIGSFLLEGGFFPAYHMNKEHWITAALDGTAPDDKIKLLLDLSFDATAPKKKKDKG